MRIKLKAYEHTLIDEACKRIIDTDKDWREQFESKTHKRLIDIYNPTSKAVDALMKRELPAGVEINIKL